MPELNAKAIIATCIDFRLQDEIEEWLEKNFGEKTYDRVALAGGVKSLDVVLDQVKIAKKLHHISRVVFINHEDCGAYGEDGTFQKHSHDLKEAKEKVHALFPELEVQLFYLNLNGTFEEIK